MREYTTADVMHEVLWSKVDEVKPEYQRAFEEWLAEVERAAAEKALLRAADSNQAEAFDTAVDLSRVRGPLFVSVRTWLTRVATEYRRNEGETDGQILDR